MNISNGQYAAQGNSLPLNRRLYAGVQPESTFEKLKQAEDACDLLQHLFRAMELYQILLPTFDDFCDTGISLCDR